MQSTIRIRGYDRVEQIGLGRRAVLYRAHDRQRNRPVAFKVLLPHLIEDPRFLKRFRRDIRVAAGIDDDHVVRVLEYGRADDSYYIAVDHYHGTRLNHLLGSCPRVPHELALLIVLEIARALQVCHEHRLIHRDVTPGAIVLTRTGHVKLDRLALATDFNGQGGLEFAGRIAGSVEYMSPEQARGENISAQSDLFSLGAVAWELFCGQNPFRAASRKDTLERIQTVEPKRVSDVNPLVEPAIADVVSRLMEQDRGARYDDAASVIADLESAARRHAYRLEKRSVTNFVEDPGAHADAERKRLISELSASVEDGDGVDPFFATRACERLCFLDPDNAEFRDRLSRARYEASKVEQTGTNGRLAFATAQAGYRVVLESVVGGARQKDAFAIELAGRLRVPLPVVQGFVRNMPVAIPGEHAHRKAAFVAGIIEELGGVVRIEACAAQSKRQKQCPECHATAASNDEHCPFCRHQFVQYVDLRPGLDEDDVPPGSSRDAASPSLPLPPFLASMPREARILAGLLLVLAVVLVVNL